MGLPVQQNEFRIVTVRVQGALANRPGDWGNLVAFLLVTDEIQIRVMNDH